MFVAWALDELLPAWFYGN